MLQLQTCRLYKQRLKTGVILEHCGTPLMSIVRFTFVLSRIPNKAESRKKETFIQANETEMNSYIKTPQNNTCPRALQCTGGYNETSKVSLLHKPFATAHYAKTHNNDKPLVCINVGFMKKNYRNDEYTSAV